VPFKHALLLNVVINKKTYVLRRFCKITDVDADRVSQSGLSIAADSERFRYSVIVHNESSVEAKHAKGTR